MAPTPSRREECDHSLVARNPEGAGHVARGPEGPGLVRIGAVWSSYGRCPLRTRVPKAPLCHRQPRGASAAKWSHTSYSHTSRSTNTNTNTNIREYTWRLYGQGRSRNARCIKKRSLETLNIWVPLCRLLKNRSYACTSVQLYGFVSVSVLAPTVTYVSVSVSILPPSLSLAHHKNARIPCMKNIRE